MTTNYLCIDIGNSRISVGLFNQDKMIDRTDFRSQQLELAIVYLINKIKSINNIKIVISSVVPELSESLIESLNELDVSVTNLKATNQSIITNIYPSIGIDRIANAVAAIKLFENKKYLAIIDFGSATTLTVVERSGKFLGGLITLGLSKTLKAITNYLDQLPDVVLDELKISSPLAFDTDRAIANGCFLSHVGTVEAWINTVRQHIDKDIFIIGTGGFIQVMHGFCPNINQTVSNLTLTGINYLGQNN